MRFVLQNLFFSLVAILLFPIIVTASERCSEESISCRIGIFPHVGAQQIRNTFGAVAEDISLELDINTKLNSAENLDKFKSNVREGQYDIALIGPGTYSSFYDKIPYIPLVRPRQKVVFNLIVTDSSNIDSIEDLNGKRFGRLNSNSGTWLTSYTMLAKANVYNKISEYIEYGSSHACIYGMVANIVDACTVPSPFIDIIKGQIPTKFKTIASSNPLPSSVYVVHKDVSKENQELLQSYFLQREDFTKASKQDYQVIRKMLDVVPK